MRTAGIALSASVLLAACASTPSGDAADSTPSARMDAGGPGEKLAAGQDVPAGYLEQAAGDIALRQQLKADLVQQRLDGATAALAALDLDAAEAEVLAALELDPDNVAAYELFARVRALQGDHAGELVTSAAELDERHQARVAQLRSDAQAGLDKAKFLIARGDYDGAIAELSLCLDRVRWAPSTMDWQGVDREAANLLEMAQRERGAAAERQLEEAQRQAYERLRAEEASESRRRDAQIDQLVAESARAFRAERYADSMRLADEALRLDAGEGRAQELRDTAYRAQRNKLRDDHLAEKRERYATWLEDMAELRVPYHEVVTNPDKAYWSRITELRAARTAVGLGVSDDAAEVALRAQVASTRLPFLKVEGEGRLSAVVKTVADMTGLPLLTDPAADDAAVEAGAEFNFDFTSPVSVDNALDNICSAAGENVTWTVKLETVLVTTTEKARGELVVKDHDIQDLEFPLTDFLAPRINRPRLIDQLEDDDGGGPFASVGERPKIMSSEDLENLVKENVAVGSWEGDGITMKSEMGHMIVTHTAEVQRQVAAFLDELRRFSSSLVTIESKFLTVEDSWLQEIGVDWRGIDNPGSPFTDIDDVTNGLEDGASNGLDNGQSGVEDSAAPQNPSSGFFFDDGGDGDFKARTEAVFGSALGELLSNAGALTAQFTLLDDAQLSVILHAVEKSSKVELVNNQVLSVHNTQRAFVSVINQRAYVQDFDVDVATFEAIADPQVNVLIEGLVLDVRPTINYDRKYLTLEIQPTVAEVVELKDFSTSLAGTTSPVTLQLPELSVKSVFTTVRVPDGGTVLIGGLSRVRNIERRAETPWLANIPLLGFFFKTEGYDDEKQSLMILLRAWITDLDEELARLEAR
jgi:general secretion pathway protein D